MARPDLEIGLPTVLRGGFADISAEFGDFSAIPGFGMPASIIFEDDSPDSGVFGWPTSLGASVDWYLGAADPHEALGDPIPASNTAVMALRADIVTMAQQLTQINPNFDPGDLTHAFLNNL